MILNLVRANYTRAEDDSMTSLVFPQFPFYDYFAECEIGVK